MRSMRPIGEVLRRLREWTRRGRVAAPPAPTRRRLLLLQIDGLSAGRLIRALRRGQMPHLAARLAAGELELTRRPTGLPPSTPVHQAALLYGTTCGIPGFSWHDRALGRTVRMDLADDVAALERELESAGGPGLLDGGGVSYGTIFTGRAADAFFNVLRWGGLGEVPPLPTGNLFDRLASLYTGSRIAARVAGRFLVELGVGIWDFQRFIRRHRNAHSEFRFLLMRAFSSVLLRDVETHGAVLDVLRGVPVVYADYLAYDEYAHRRGPDSRLALANLAGIDEAIGEVLDAAASVPEYGYEVFVESDHGQSAAIPFARVVGEEAPQFILRRAGGERAAFVDGRLVRELVRVRYLRMWARQQRRPLRTLCEPYFAWLEHRSAARLRREDPVSADVVVVTGGSIAHVYLDHRPTPALVDEIQRRRPSLLPELAACPGIGIVVARGRTGPVMFHRGRRYRLADRARWSRLPSLQGIDDELLTRHLAAAVASSRSGDLVLFGAFAPAGNVSFDYELGAHGGVHPDELDTFLIHPRGLAPPVGKTVRADDLYRYFRRRYRAEAA